MSLKAKRIAILGAGLSGSLTAFLLKDHFEVSLFDKSRGYGGRLAAWWLDSHGEQRINKGAKSLSDLGEEALNRLESSIRSSTSENLVFSDISKNLAEGIGFGSSTTITRISQADDKLELWSDSESLGEFDDLIITFPAPQVVSLFKASYINGNVKNITLKELDLITYHSVYTLIIEISEEDSKLWSDLIHHPKVSKVQIVRRGKSVFAVIDSTVEFGNRYEFDDKQHISEQFLNELLLHLDLQSKRRVLVHNHRWKYAFPKKSINKDFLKFIVGSNFIYCIGDYFSNTPLSSSYSSSNRVTDHIIGN